MARTQREKLGMGVVPLNDRKARDEGPRLLPQEEEQRIESRLDHYIKLANIALGLWRGDHAEKLRPK
jgi:hypothetical protein